MSENLPKRPQILQHRSGQRRKKRRFYGNQFTKLKAKAATSEDLEVENADSSTTNFDDSTVEFSKNILGSFNWRPYLRKQGFTAAPVSCFKHVALSNCWESIVENVRVEVRSPDCKGPNCNCTTNPCRYWLATVIKVCGYWGLLRYDGFDKITPKYFNVPDKWVNLCTEPHIHPIGWCAKNGKLLVPPKSIEPKIICWRDFLMEMLPGGRTLPPDFTFRIEEHSHNSIKKGMKLEVVDKNLISVVRSAMVTDVVGGRLHIKYSECGEEEEDEGFWCHERSPLIHPVGWAQIIGHALKASPEYARLSLKKTLYRTFEPDDATWDMFLPVYNPIGNLKFKKKMKLEAIDPLNLSAICVATVTEVLRNNYLMIGIDGMMAANGADCFCYHASSPCIFPVGFCESNGIKLTPPKGYKTEFKWSEYLKKTKSEAAPVDLFRRDIPDHGFKESMFLEAVDLMEPRLICVAYVTKVVGRLLKIHFDGWEEDYDQWCDCESPDLFPIGWCDVLGYRLEPPRVDGSEEKKKKKTVVKKRKKKYWSRRPAGSDDSPIVFDEDAKKNDFEDSKGMLNASVHPVDEQAKNNSASVIPVAEQAKNNSASVIPVAEQAKNNGSEMGSNFSPQKNVLICFVPVLIPAIRKEVEKPFSETQAQSLVSFKNSPIKKKQSAIRYFNLPDFSNDVQPLLNGDALSEVERNRLSSVLKEELISFLNSENLISSGNTSTRRWEYRNLAESLASKYPKMLWDLPSDKQRVKKENASVYSVFIRRLTERRKMKRLREKAKLRTDSHLLVEKADGFQDSLEDTTSEIKSVSLEGAEISSNILRKNELLERSHETQQKEGLSESAEFLMLDSFQDNSVAPDDSSSSSYQGKLRGPPRRSLATLSHPSSSNIPEGKPKLNVNKKSTPNVTPVKSVSIEESSVMPSEQKRLRSKRITYEECPDPELDKFRTRRRRRKQKKSVEMILEDSSSNSSFLDLEGDWEANAAY